MMKRFQAVLLTVTVTLLAALASLNSISSELYRFGNVDRAKSLAISDCSIGPLRDKHKQPFSCGSIWNRPIGSSARYLPAGIGIASSHHGDENYYIVTDDSDPVVSWYDPKNWGSGRCNPETKLNGSIHVPFNLTVPDAAPHNTPNNAAAFLQPDGRTLIQMTALARCIAGGPVFGYAVPGYPTSYENIYGMGITGGHGGSGLSSIGGMIRLGELLTSSEPIQHALQLEVFGKKYLYGQPPGYRWPAVQADSYAFDLNSETHYAGTNPSLVMGVLLAIPPSVDEAMLKLLTVPGRKLFHALQDYGGYIVDDTAWDSHGLGIEKGVEEEFAVNYGYAFGGYSGDFHSDVNHLFQALQIVDNNAPSSIGGGGDPRKPLPTSIGN